MAIAECAAGQSLVAAVKIAGGEWSEWLTLKVRSACAHAHSVYRDSKVVEQGHASVISDPRCETLVRTGNTGARRRGQEVLTRQELNTVYYGHQGCRGRSAAAGFFDQPSSDIYCFIARVE